MATIKDLLSAMISKINKAPKTVNGVEPDENGNVVTTPSWDELENRPFGEETFVENIKWDGVIDGKCNIPYGSDNGISLVYPNVVPAPEDLIGHTVTLLWPDYETGAASGVPLTVTLTEDMLFRNGDNEYGFTYNNTVSRNLIEVRPNGLYLFFQTNSDSVIGYVTGIDYPVSQISTKTIDSKYFPEYLQLGSRDNENLFSVVSESEDGRCGCMIAGLNINHNYTIAVRGDIYENLSAWHYDGYYDFYYWGAYGPTSEYSPYPIGFNTFDNTFDENGDYDTTKGYVPPELVWNPNIYPNLDPKTEVKVYLSSTKTLDAEYVPEYAKSVPYTNITKIIESRTQWDNAGVNNDRQSPFDSYALYYPSYNGYHLQPNTDYCVRAGSQLYILNSGDLINSDSESYYCFGNQGTLDPDYVYSEGDFPFSIILTLSGENMFARTYARNAFENITVYTEETMNRAPNVVTVTVQWPEDDGYPIITGVDRSAKELYDMLKNGHNIVARERWGDEYSESCAYYKLEHFELYEYDGEIGFDCSFTAYEPYDSLYLYGIELWNDGQNVSGEVFERDIMAECLPFGDKRDLVAVYEDVLIESSGNDKGDYVSYDIGGNYNKPLYNNRQYLVIINGVEYYTRGRKDIQNSVYIGNFAVHTNHIGSPYEDTGEPFLIGVETTYGSFMVKLKPEISAPNPVISVYEYYGGEIVKIDPKYLPEGGTVVVNISGNPSAGFIADKTPTEVHALIESGVTVVCAISASEDETIYLYHSFTTFTYDDDDNRIPSYEFQSLRPSGPYVTFTANKDAAWVGQVVAQVMSDNSIVQVVKSLD